MKQTILALGAAAALGFAGAAHAIAYMGEGATFDHIPQKVYDPVSKGVVVMPEAGALENAAGGVGHMLYVPYFTAQDKNQTIFTIVNTDTSNGKAVKVRFRSAVNSDDLLDFTVLLSPGDVWTASLAQRADGVPVLKTPDNSCTLPTFTANGTPMIFDRLPSYVSGEVMALQSREGYIEVLNMADVPAKLGGTTDANPLWTAIKHGSDPAKPGVPGNCGDASVANLFTPDAATDAADAEKAGLAVPTGGLLGSWWILNQADLASFSGNMTAIRAVEQAGGAPAYGNIVFAPQSGDDATPDSGWTAGTAVEELTADPLFSPTGTMTAAWFDLPDMSTPLVKTYNSTPALQIVEMGLAHGAIMNEYTNAPNGSVPMTTDWVVSQPTRRYYAAMEYGGSAAGATIYWNADMSGAGNATPIKPAVSDNPYANLTKGTAAGAPAACLKGAKVQTQDREEGGTSTGAAWSPGSAVTTCGEVFTLNFGGRSMLRAQATNSTVSPIAGEAGWGKVDVGAVRLPLVGFAATAATNELTGIHYDTTYAHRWND